MVYQLYTIVYVPFIQPFYFDLQCDDIFEMDVDHKKHNETYVIVIPWARVVCLIYTPEARGPQARGLRVYISGKSRVPMA